MAHINITRSHKLPAKKAKIAAKLAGKRLSEEFGLKCQWDEEGLHFERPGVDGYLHLDKGSIRIVLSLMLLPFKQL